MQLYFITYSDNNYSTFQDRLIAKAEASGEFDHVIGYTREWLETTQFYKDNKALLDQTIGGGFWCWKHFIILTTIDKMADDDILLYLDCGDDFLEGIGQFLKETMQTKDFLLTDGAFMNYDWTKKECFVMMKCDNENYWYTIQLEAGIIVLKRTLFVKQLLEEWGTYCKIPEIINNDNITSDFPSFKEHRNDQSILTNLKTKHNLYSDISLRRMINCNVHSIPSISINVTIHNKAFLLPQVLGSIKKFTTGKYD